MRRSPFSMAESILSVTAAIRETAEATPAALSRRMSAQSPGSPAAIRVVSRQPPAVNCRASAGVAAAIAAASRWGAWLVAASSRSWSRGGIISTFEPSPAQNPPTSSASAPGVAAAGVTTVTRPSNRSALAAAGPRRWLPAIGCAPTNRPRRDRRRFSQAETIEAFVLPASVISVPGLTAASIASSSPGIDPTPVATRTTSASATPAARSRVVRVTVPALFASASDTADLPMPITSRASRRATRARPTEPPIRPTPTIATVGHCRGVRWADATVVLEGDVVRPARMGKVFTRYEKS